MISLILISVHVCECVLETGRHCLIQSLRGSTVSGQRVRWTQREEREHREGTGQVGERLCVRPGCESPQGDARRRQHSAGRAGTVWVIDIPPAWSEGPRRDCEEEDAGRMTEGASPGRLLTGVEEEEELVQAHTHPHAHTHTEVRVLVLLSRCWSGTSSCGSLFLPFVDLGVERVLPLSILLSTATRTTLCFPKRVVRGGVCGVRGRVTDMGGR